MDYYNPDQLTIVLLGSEASRMWRAQVGQQGIAAAVQANVGEDGRTALPEQGVTSASGDNEERGKRPVPKAGHGRALQRVGAVAMQGETQRGDLGRLPGLSQHHSLWRASMKTGISL